MVTSRLQQLAGGQETVEQAMATLLRTAEQQVGELHSLAGEADRLARQASEQQAAFAALRERSARRDDELRSIERSLHTSLEAVHRAHPLLRATDRHAEVQYQRLIHRIRGVVRAALPPNCVVIVASKGDDALLRFQDRQGWHFPQADTGVYAGHYPADSAAAIAHLEALRATGGNFLLFPQTALWWLEHYGAFGQHLENRYRAIVTREDTCVIFAL
jgi:hypothetical protein